MSQPSATDRREPAERRSFVRLGPQPRGLLGDEMQTPEVLSDSARSPTDPAHRETLAPGTELVSGTELVINTELVAVTEGVI